MTFCEVTKRLGLFAWILIVAFVIFYIGALFYNDNENILSIVYALAGLIATELTCLIDKNSNFFKLVIYVSIVLLLVYALSLYMGITLTPFLLGYWITIIYAGWCRISR